MTILEQSLPEMKKKLLYYHVLNYQRENLQTLRSHFDVISLPTPEDDTLEILSKINVILAPLGYYLGREKIDTAKHLEVIASNTTGVPHIDVEYAKARDIMVISLKDESTFLSTITPTAEHTWGLMLALLRRLPWAFEHVKAGMWNRRFFGGNAMLSRMSLGVAGYGRLGRMVTSYGRCFGMKVAFYDPFVPDAEAEVVRHRTLSALVSNSDIITVHIPHEPSTEGMFNRDIFDKFKPGSYFVNTSRGELVDHKALLENLRNGNLAGAALDVFEGEFEAGFQESFQRHPLLKYARENDNLIITPHIGGSTLDAWRLTEKYTLKRVIEALRLS